MARKKRIRESSLTRFQRDLNIIDREVGQNLRLSSLNQTPPRLEGYSFKYTLTLPLMSQSGEEVFTGQHLSILHALLCQRFGGCSVTSSTSHPPIYGFYQPTEEASLAKDFHTQHVVYTAPLDSANGFFARLKAVLRTAPLQPQEEILVERLDAMLI